MKRRNYLRNLGMMALGGGAVYAWSQGERLPGDVTINLPENKSVPFTDGALPTETALKTVKPEQFTLSELKKVILYKSGAAEVYLQADHSDNIDIAVTHAANDLATQPYATWDTPDFSGPVVIDLQAVVKNNGDYPSRQFKIGTLAEGSPIVGGSPVSFEVPKSYMS